MDMKFKQVSCPKCGAENIAPFGIWICLTCGNQNISGEFHADTAARPLAEFDSALATITQRRGTTYGHPGDDFAKVAAMVERLPHWEDRRFSHIASMLMVKLARLAADPTHVDSLVDIAGYSRCWAMILERDYPNGGNEKTSGPRATNPNPRDHQATPHSDEEGDSNDGNSAIIVGQPRRDPH